ncbi:MAG: glyoxalase/bleomycin resistance/dioxygenase family protein [Actinomycetia bacterium]|jgi:lactoylglutathione lyase|nr:glyoxalase/bleomycin resistance/dioxygenase family protein [Actinomycetes bacterium]
MTSPEVLNHVGVGVTDVERSRRFYEGALGFEYWYELYPPDEMSDKLLQLPKPGLHAVYLRLGAFVLELLRFAEPEPFVERTMNMPGLTHLSVSVEDIPAACAKVREFGGTVIEETDIELAIMVRDPDGQLIELLPVAFREKLPPFPPA